MNSRTVIIKLWYFVVFTRKQSCCRQGTEKHSFFLMPYPLPRMTPPMAQAKMILQTLYCRLKNFSACAVPPDTSRWCDFDISTSHRDSRSSSRRVTRKTQMTSQQLAADRDNMFALLHKPNLLLPYVIKPKDIRTLGALWKQRIVVVFLTVAVADDKSIVSPFRKW